MSSSHGKRARVTTSVEDIRRAQRSVRAFLCRPERAESTTIDAALGLAQRTAGASGVDGAALLTLR